VAGQLSLRVQQLEVRCETKTKDNVFVTLMVSVQYQVKRVLLYEDGPPPAAFYKLTNSHQQISSYVFDVVRATVPKMDLDDVFTEKRAIALSIKEELTKSMAMFGYDILQALVNDIAPDAKVKAAMNDINAAQRLRVAAADKAEAAKIKVVKQAEAEAEAKYLSGVGVARQRQAIVTGLRQSVKDFHHSVAGVTPQDVLELMLIVQYYDMLREVGAQQKTNTIFTPSGEGDGFSNLRTPLLEAGACQEMSRS
jgi:regulator of protease activity HflC (stomatin/prohibitin superfamily)